MLFILRCFRYWGRLLVVLISRFTCSGYWVSISLLWNCLSRLVWVEIRKVILKAVIRKLFCLMVHVCVSFMVSFCRSTSEWQTIYGGNTVRGTSKTPNCKSMNHGKKCTSGCLRRGKENSKDWQKALSQRILRNPKVCTAYLTLL